MAAELGAILEEVAGAPSPRRVPVPAVLRAASDNNRGVSMMELGQVDRALSFFEDAIANVPNFLEARFNRALARWRRGELEPDDVRSEIERLAAGNRPDRIREAHALVALEEGDAHRLDELLGDTSGWDARRVKYFRDERRALDRGNYATTASVPTDKPVAWVGAGRDRRAWRLVTSNEVVDLDESLGVSRRIRRRTIAEAFVADSIVVRDSNVRDARGVVVPTLAVAQLDEGLERDRYEEVPFASSTRARDATLRVSLDSAWVAVGSPRDGTKVVELATRRVHELPSSLGVAWHPNGELLVRDGSSARWFDPHGGAYRNAEFELRSSLPESLAISHDGAHLVASGPHGVDVRSLPSGERLWRTGPTRDCEFVTCGDSILCVDKLRIRVFCRSTGQVIRAFPLGDPVGSKERVVARAGYANRYVVLEPHRRRLTSVVVANERRKAPWWMAKPRSIEELYSDERRVTEALDEVARAFEAGDFASAIQRLSDARAIDGIVLNPRFQRLIAAVEPHGERGGLHDVWELGESTVDPLPFRGFVLLPGGEFIGATARFVPHQGYRGGAPQGAEAGSVFRGGLRGGMRRLEGFAGIVSDMAISGDARRLLVAYEGTYALCWDVAELDVGQPFLRVDGFKTERRGVAGVAVDGAGRIGAVADDACRVVLIDLEHRAQRELMLTEPGVGGLAIDAAGRWLLAFGRHRRTATLIDVATGAVISEIRANVSDACFAPDGSYAWICDTRGARQIAIPSCEIGTRVDLEDAAQLDLWSERDTLIIASGTGDLHVVDTRSGSVIRSLRGVGGRPRRIRSTPDRRELVSVNGLGSGRIVRWAFDWDVQPNVVPWRRGSFVESSGVPEPDGRAIWRAALSDVATDPREALADGVTARHRRMIAEMNAILVELLAAAANVGAHETRATLRGFIAGSKHASLLGVLGDGPKPIDIARVERAMRSEEDHASEAALRRALYELGTFALFCVSSVLPLDTRVALASDVNRRLRML